MDKKPSGEGLTAAATGNPMAESQAHIDRVHLIARLREVELFEELGTSPRGLSASQAAERLEKYGRNEIQKVKGTPLILKFLSNFIHLFAILLWVGAALSFIAGVPELGYAILAVIFINATFSFWQEFKAEKATEALMRLLPAKTTVLRDGEVVEILAVELVPGDLMVLSEGDSISADGRIIQEFEMRTNNATLTGESEPARRTAEPVLDESLLPGEIPNLALAGTSVAYGNGRALVYGTGMFTEFGKIANLAQTVKTEKSPLFKEMEFVTRVIATIATSLGVVFFFAGTYLGGMSLTSGFLFAIGIIIANVPEGLLPTITLSLAMGVQRMARRHALIKELAAVETLGSTNVICTDKTGTLTQNEMTVRALWLDGEEIEVTGAGYDPTSGGAEIDPDRVSTGTVWVLSKAASFANNAQLVPPAEGLKWTVRGDPTEGALLVAAKKLGFNYADMSKQEPRTYELPFDSVRKRMSTIHTVDGGVKMAYVKGAPLETLALCAAILSKDGEKPLTQEVRDAIAAANDRFARGALRVLAMAYREIPSDLKEYDIDSVEHDLVFVGLMAMMDPPRPEVEAAVKESKQAGIKTIMITGDYGLTAESIARKIGIVQDEHAKIVVGAQLDKMSDEALKNTVLEEGILFARVSPEHKMRVVSALKEQGMTVAVTGDGVNDAPALRRADIGVAMGITGTDVAKESAQMVLTDDNFATIVHAIEEGRGVFLNIRRFITYIFASNIPEIIPFILFVLFKIPLALTVLQILAVDLGTDMVPALALGAEKPEPGIMKQPPRGRGERLLNPRVLARAYLWLGAIQGITSMVAFLIFLNINGWTWSELPELNRVLLDGTASPQLVNLYRQATTITLSAIVALQIGNGFAVRTTTESVFKMGLFTNRMYLWGIVSEIAILFLLIYVPPLSNAFGLAPVPLEYMAYLLILAPLILLLEEGRKWSVRNYFAKKK
ncbi:MAG: cation-translocating P-type ATPase [Candidatus Aquicultorales bacterium]